MTRHRAEEARTKAGRVSPLAPDTRSPSFLAWGQALGDPGVREALDEGLADLEAGRTRPWDEVRPRTRSK